MDVMPAVVTPPYLNAQAPFLGMTGRQYRRLISYIFRYRFDSITIFKYITICVGFYYLLIFH